MFNSVALYEFSNLDRALSKRFACHAHNRNSGILILSILGLLPFASSTTTQTMESTTTSISSFIGPTILVTGGCGFIGSHTLTCLLEANYSIVVVDNLSNSSSISLDRVADICNLSPDQRHHRLQFHKVDLCNEHDLRKVFVASPKFQACIHFAGLKAVGESQKIPLRYYENNITGTLVLLRLLQEFDCTRIVFSSSATVYGAATRMPITEDTPVGTGITNAYGRTKYMIEEILKDFYHSLALNTSNTTGSHSPKWAITILRYFNPVGAHSSGRIGEDPNGIPNNLMPYVAQVAIGRRPYLTVFGKDYDTPDGTGVRDYIHVMDLAQGHVSAIQYMAKKEEEGGFYTFNLGTGIGYSVLQMVQAMTKACGHEIPYQMGDRRPGDIATCYSDASLAEREMGWTAHRGLDEMCSDLWRWQQLNPQGFQ
jgi:UDP-glucose 4-epimerase